MPNICKPKGVKDDKQNIEFERGQTAVHIVTPRSSISISKEDFAAKYEVVTEETTQPKE